MWAIRRASIPLRSRSHRVVVACCSTPPELRSGETESRAVGASVLPGSSAGGFSVSATAGSYLWSRNLSSQAGEKSSDAEELEEGFSDLEVPPPEADPKSEEEDVVVVWDDEEEAEAEGALGLLEVDAMEVEKGVEGKSWRSTDSPLFKSLMETRQTVLHKSLMGTGQTVGAVLNKLTEEGKPLGRNEIMVAMLKLRRRRLFTKAFLFMKLLEKNKCIDFIERDYAFHLDLVAKVNGLFSAENFIDRVPESFRGEVVYRTLLANCVSRGDNVRAERVFNRIRALFPITTFVCNQMLLLYKRTDPKRITRILNLMEEEDIQPSLFTYKLLIDTKCRAKDVKGMEEIIETMKSKGMEPDLGTQAMVARHYISGGHREKAEAILKEIEGEEDIKNNRFACRLLLPLYASLGKDAEVERIWKAGKNKLRLEDCSTAIEAFGEVGKVEVAEEVFEHMVKTSKNLSAKHYTVLLKVYAKHKLLDKGKDLVKRMVDSGCRIPPLTWDAIVKFYAEAGEVERADAIIQRAVQRNNTKPLYNSYITMMEKYAERGDVHNAEKIFHKLKQSEYVERRMQYEYRTLLQAYINSKRPAYGFRERMKADNMLPDGAVEAQLATVDGFNFIEPPPFLNCLIDDGVSGLKIGKSC